AVTSDGRVLLNRDALSSCNDFGDWVKDHRQQVPEQFPFDSAREAFASTYPFHPSILSVFERKWQALPRFQQTRGVLRLLALWVARSYQAGYNGAHRDPLIDPGTAPLDDPLFRAAAFEQLGESKLALPVTTDIIGRRDSHATRLDDGRRDPSKSPAAPQGRHCDLFRVERRAIAELRDAAGDPPGGRRADTGRRQC